MKKFLRANLVLALLFLAFAVVGLKNVNAAGVGAGPVGNNLLRAYAGPGVGEVTLEWQRFSMNGENYSVWYGNQLGNYPYAADHIGYITTYTVRNLTPGKLYYFGLQPIWVGDQRQAVSGVVSIVAPATPVTVIGTPGPIGRNMLTAKKGPKSGQITLTWNKYFSDTQGWNIVYGNKPGQYVYGALNAVQVTDQSRVAYSYTIGALVPGHRYYIALVPQRASIGGTYVTSEVSMIAR